MANGRPHVLVLCADQMQHDRMGFVDGLSHTPHLDALAAESVHFANAFTVHGQCTPSRCALLSGRYPHEVGVMAIKGFAGHQNVLDGERFPTFGHAFRDAGYRTAYFGKMHLYQELEGLGFDEGVETTHMAVSDADSDRLDVHHVPEGLRQDYYAVDAAEAWLRDYEPDGRPLCFVFSTNLPHPPFFTEPHHARRWDASKLPLPKSYFEEDFGGKPAFQKAHAEDGRHGAGDPEAAREELKQYLTMIAAMDEHFGRVIAQFKRLGLWDETLVLFTADHGDMMNGHRMRLKGTLPYDELYRVPLMIRPPGGRGADDPARVERLVSSERAPGTLVKLAGVKAPETFAHGDFAALLTEPEAETPPVCFEHYAAYWGVHPFYGVRTASHKYVRYFGEDDAEELYDLARDPDELHNRAGDPGYVEVQRDLSRQAEAWWRRTNGKDADFYASEAFKQSRAKPWD